MLRSAVVLCCVVGWCINYNEVKSHDVTSAPRPHMYGLIWLYGCLLCNIQDKMDNIEIFVLQLVSAIMYDTVG